MASPKKVLVIAEGKNDKSIIKRIFEVYKKNVEVVTFKTEIYQLYDMYEAQGVKYEDIDLQQTLLTERTNLTPNEKKILQDRYVDIFLIFDFDPHASHAEIRKLEKLASHFKDSSDMGKLYINYPMMESYQHIAESKLKAGLVDKQFLESRFSDKDLIKESNQVRYKVRAKQEGFSRKQLTKNEWNLLISHHLYKIESIVGSLRKVEYSQRKFLELLLLQGKSYQEDKTGYILNTSVTIIPELYPRDWHDFTNDIALSLKQNVEF